MDSLIIIVALIAIIFFVRYDLMLFAVLFGLLLIVVLFIKFLGGVGSSFKGPMSAIKEDLSVERKEIEKARGSYPTGSTLMKIYKDFIEFLVGDRSGEKEHVKGGHGGSHAHDQGGAHVEGIHSDEHGHAAAEGSHEEHQSG